MDSDYALSLGWEGACRLLGNIESVGYRHHGVLARECMGIALKMDSGNGRTLGVWWEHALVAWKCKRHCLMGASSLLSSLSS